ncbi:TetR/AcrR family transcriptional regulator [Bosea sp. (in: a-proteobacteria)]|uniref:TetR/AcrR family transcriptional regulator n=1 Tax=Bosea sp. (in: a-proteobacteria) TaxID=1871050 RepID=UPI00333E36D7
MARKATGLRERNRQHRIALILSAASRLFARHGYESTRIEEIAEAAEVAPATVYNYFTNKANILTALAARHAYSSWAERSSFVQSPPEDPVAAVQGFERLLADQAMRTLGRECWRIILAAPYAQPGSRLHRAGVSFGWLIERHYRRMLRTFQERGRIGADVDIRALAELITAIGTYHFGRFISDESMTLDMLKEHIEKHVLIIFLGVVPRTAGMEAEAAPP